MTIDGGASELEPWTTIPFWPFLDAVKSEEQNLQRIATVRICSPHIGHGLVGLAVETELGGRIDGLASPAKVATGIWLPQELQKVAVSATIWLQVVQVMDILSFFGLSTDRVHLVIVQTFANP